MAQIKFSQTNATVLVPASGKLTVPKGFKWRVRQAHAQLDTGVAAGNRRMLIFAAMESNGPDGGVLADTGVTAVASTTHRSEGGLSSQFFYGESLGEAANNVPWNGEIVLHQGHTINLQPTLQGADTFTYKIVIEEEAA